MSVADMQSYASQVANQYGIPTDLFAKVITAESNWNPNALSSKGAIGLGQLLPSTASSLGVNPWNWQQNLDGAGRYLKSLQQKFGDWTSAVAAYNAGPGTISNVLNGTRSLPSETQNYLNKIFGDSTNGASSSGQGVFSDDNSTRFRSSIGGQAYTKIGDWKDALLNFFSLNTGERLVGIVIGILFLGAAVFVLASGTRTGQAIIKTGKDAVLAAA